MKNRSFKQKLLLVLLISSFIISTLFPSAFAADNAAITPGTTITNNGTTLKAYDWPLYGKDLLKMNLKDYGDFLKTISFDKYTKWPSVDKLPDNFDPQKIMEWGKNPGLGINDLHELGYTGKGVNIAYVDQTLQPDHVEYNGTNVKYFIEDPRSGAGSSMHGSVVLSILAGQTTGIAPDANVYFVGDNNTNDDLVIAQSIRKIIEINKTLPVDKKIKILGLSNGPSETRTHKGEYSKAVSEAEAAGIMVFDVTTLDGMRGIVGMYIEPFKDKDDPNNYMKDQGPYGGDPHEKGLLCVPGTGTFANGTKKDDYLYSAYSGTSWLVPYIEGVIALGLQVDPTLTKEKAIQYLYDSATQTEATSGSIGLINPKGFIELVKKNAKNLTFINNPGDNDYYYLLYNGDRVSSDDFTLVRSYASQLNNNTVLVDVSKYVNYNENDIKNSTGMSATISSFKNIYDYLKNDSLKRTGNLKGIQLFGGVEDVPGCYLYAKIKNSDTSIDGDQGGGNVTDFFYNNFDNDSSIFTTKFSIYSMFDGSTNINLNPKWKVARLPLKKGEYKSFITKYYDYVVKAKKQGNIPLVNFTNPIFPFTTHIDDVAYFLNRLNSEFSILPSGSYKLYGNLDGKYPVTTKVLGNFTKDNLAKENSLGIADFLIDSHGQPGNIDQAIFDKRTGKEKRISFINTNTANHVLNKNYYTLNLWTCSNAYNLRNDSLVHEVLANGKCVSAIATVQEISNRGVNNNSSLENMKNNNYFYFQYLFYQNLSMNYSRTDSFFEAQKGYLKEILSHKTKNSQGYYDYQYNLQNVMSAHYLGLLENGYSSKRFMDFSNNSQSNNTQTQKFDGTINFKATYATGKFKVNSLKAKIVGQNIQFTLNYKSDMNNDFSFFNPPNGSKIMKIYKGGIHKGKNEFKFNLNMKEFNTVLNANLITMIFGFNKTNDYIVFETAQLKPLLNFSNVAVTGVKLNKSSITLNAGVTASLLATIAPNNATNKSVIWSTSNKKVVTVDQNGKLKAVGAGKAVVTAMAKDGHKAAKCNVTVKTK